jgi:hypothetical protein
VEAGSRRFLASTLLSASSGAISTQLQHVADIGGTGRIGVDRLLEIGGAQPRPYGEGKKVDDLFGMHAKKVGAQDAICALFDEHLEAARA